MQERKDGEVLLYKGSWHFVAFFGYIVRKFQCYTSCILFPKRDEVSRFLFLDAIYKITDIQYEKHGKYVLVVFDE